MAIAWSIVLAVAILLGMGLFSTALGVYLLLTNPPKDRYSFVGFREEKMTDDELSDGDAA